MSGRKKYPLYRKRPGSVALTTWQWALAAVAAALAVVGVILDFTIGGNAPHNVVGIGVVGMAGLSLWGRRR